MFLMENHLDSFAAFQWNIRAIVYDNDHIWAKTIFSGQTMHQCMAQCHLKKHIMNPNSSEFSDGRTSAGERERAREPTNGNENVKTE